MKKVSYVKKQGKFYVPTKEMKEIAFSSEETYKQAKNRIQFWENLASEGIDWYKKWKTAYKQKKHKFSWFDGGKLNACYNAIDRHLKNKETANKPALIFVPEPIKEKKQVITYQQLHNMVNHAASILKGKGIKKGDVVVIYLPLIPEIIIFMLACARIGAIHSVVFSAFSADALKMRIKDGRAKLLITADKYFRKGKKIDLKKKAQKACKGLRIKKIIVKRSKAGRNLKKNNTKTVKPVEMNSEDLIFILYTSGTTGKPKGVMHATGGYCVQAYWSTKLAFNLQGTIWCTADIGWVTGHTYACYGPLLNGETSVIFEGMLDWPKPSRYLDIIKQNKVSVFYTAPTALRLFALYGKKYTKKYKLDSLQVLGSVGEPIDKETWMWFFKNIGKGRCPIIDTYWQTETGSSIINSLPGAGPFIPTYAGRSFPGMEHEVVNEKGKRVRPGKKGLLVQLPPFCPALIRGVWRNKKRYKKYFKNRTYITGDNAFRNKKGYFRILGRSDDVIKVAGHRLSTAEIENAITSHPAIVEAAIVAMPHKIKAEVPVAFVHLKKNQKIEEKQIKSLVTEKISPIARPQKVFFVNDLPKTRSGKIMRRILKYLLTGEKIKNITTLLNPNSVEEVRQIIKTESKK